jgi:Tfp pilus assembly protein PilO
MSRLLPLIAIVFALALIFLYIRPTYSDSITATRDQIKSFDDALAAAERFQQKEAELTQARAQIPAESLSRLNEFLPDGVDNVQLILDLNALAARSGMTLSDFDTNNQSDGTTDTSQAQGQALGAQPMGLVSSSPIDSLDLTFKATGTYSSFRTFLDGMEASLRQLDVVNVDLQKSDTGVYTYTVTARIYWLR